MTVVIGTLLVLLTWTGLVVITVAVGLGPALATARHQTWPAALRTAIWLGLGILTVIVLLTGLWRPLRSAPTAWVLGVAIGAFGLWSAMAAARRPRLGWPAGRLGGPRLAVVLATATVVVYEAAKALGPVTNYDTGMYHLGAIKYAAEYPTIPGLANLFFPFGYSNSWFPIAATLGNGPWDGIGYRLAGGFILTLVLADLVLRLRERAVTWGTATLLLGVTAACLPLVAIADFWVVSPTSDTPILLLTLIAVAALVDVLARPSADGNAVIVIVTAGLLVSMRPTMIVFAAASLGVLVAIWWRRGHEGLPPEVGDVTRTGRWVLGAWVALLAGVQILRDVLLSGWLLYPLSILFFDVPWLASDPTDPRDATLAAARNPGAPDHWQVAHSWTWISTWLVDRLSMWETYLFGLASLAAIVALILARTVAAPLPWRNILLAALPSALAVVFWFLFSPPSYRFIFGPLFMLPIVVLAAALVALASSGPKWAWAGTVILVASAVVLFAVTGFSAMLRNQFAQISQERIWSLGALSVTYAVAPLPIVETTPVVTSRGLQVRVPINGGDQCWDVWPLCTWSPPADLGLRGDDLQDGFIGANGASDR